MNIEKIIEEFVFKFKCKKCGKILGGVKNNSTIIFFCWTSRAQNDTGITGAICECGEENIFNIKNILEKLFDMNLKAVLESSAQREKEKKSQSGKIILKCVKCKKLLAIHKNGQWVVKNIKGIISLKDNGQKEIECICGEKTQIGT